MAMPVDMCRVLVLGAHPDDAEVYAGGLIVRHCNLGHVVRIVSVTDGRSGHFKVPPSRLVEIRRTEAARAGEVIGAEYHTWDFPDGSLLPDIATREAIIRQIRNFKPDLVLTHRPNDYHPDHRAVGQAVQDASYMVTVPHVCPDTVALRADPVVAYMCDTFTRPNILRADIVLNVEQEFETALRMAACHRSQFYEWLPYHDGKLDLVPNSEDGKLAMLRAWLREYVSRRHQHFSDAISSLKIAVENAIEVFEVSEYARTLDDEMKQRLFPGYLQ
jgi:N-acetylglucosamine malate deacetylase 1